MKRNGLAREFAGAAKGYDKMMRGYEKAMKAATGSLHLDAAYRAACGSFNDAAYRAAFGSTLEAAYSEFRRATEMTHAALVPNFAQQVQQFSDTARQICESATGGAALREADLGMQASRDAIEATIGSIESLQTSLTRDLVSSFESFQKSFDLSAAFDAAAVRRIGDLRESVRAALTPFESNRIGHSLALLPPPVRQEPINPAAQFMASLRRHHDEAVKQAEEKGGKVVIHSTTPTGDPISVSHVTSLDEHFVMVEGFDLNKQPRRFKANWGGVNLAFEVVPIEEDLEEEEDCEDEPLVN